MYKKLLLLWAIVGFVSLKAMERTRFFRIGRAASAIASCLNSLSQEKVEEYIHELEVEEPRGPEKCLLGQINGHILSALRCAGADQTTVVCTIDLENSKNHFDDNVKILQGLITSLQQNPVAQHVSYKYDGTQINLKIILKNKRNITKNFSKAAL